MAFRKSPKKLDANGLWEYSLKLLALRPHSAGELRQKLRLRAAEAADANAALDKLREYGLADDRLFSEAFATARLQNQGFGKMRVLRDLQTKRVGADTAAKAVSKVFENTSEAELIEQFLARKYRSKNLAAFLQEDKNLMSVYRRLRLAGFASAPSLTTLRRYKSDLPEIEENDEEPG